MENENMTNEVEEIENTTNEVEEIENTEESKGISKAVAIGVGLIGVGIGALIYRNRDKFEKRKIERLRKKGYTIFGPGEFIESDEDDSEETDESDE